MSLERAAQNPPYTRWLLTQRKRANTSILLPGEDYLIYFIIKVNCNIQNMFIENYSFRWIFIPPSFFYKLHRDITKELYRCCQSFNEKQTTHWVTEFLYSHMIRSVHSEEIYEKKLFAKSKKYVSQNYVFYTNSHFVLSLTTKSISLKLIDIVSI